MVTLPVEMAEELLTLLAEATGLAVAQDDHDQAEAFRAASTQLNVYILAVRLNPLHAEEQVGQ